MDGEGIANPFQQVLDKLEERLDRQDAALAQLREGQQASAHRDGETRALLAESAEDRRGIHAEMDALRQERARLVQEAQVYQEATETRLKAVEARDSITEIQAAIWLQLTVHRWITNHKVRVRLTAAVMFFAALYGKEVVTASAHAILHRLGWQ